MVFGLFHGTKYVTISWKNPNFDNCIAKFGCGSGRKFLEFFRILQKKVHKIVKDTNIFLQFQFEKNIFLNFDQFLKSEWDSPDGDGDSQCERHDEF